MTVGRKGDNDLGPYAANVCGDLGYDLRRICLIDIAVDKVEETKAAQAKLAGRAAPARS